MVKGAESAVTHLHVAHLIEKETHSSVNIYFLNGVRELGTVLNCENKALRANKQTLQVP